MTNLSDEDLEKLAKKLDEGASRRWRNFFYTASLTLLSCAIILNAHLFYKKDKARWEDKQLKKQNIEAYITHIPYYTYPGDNNFVPFVFPTTTKGIEAEKKLMNEIKSNTSIHIMGVEGRSGGFYPLINMINLKTEKLPDDLVEKIKDYNINEYNRQNTPSFFDKYIREIIY